MARAENWQEIDASQLASQQDAVIVHIFIGAAIIDSKPSIFVSKAE